MRWSALLALPLLTLACAPARAPAPRWLEPGAPAAAPCAARLCLRGGARLQARGVRDSCADRAAAGVGVGAGDGASPGRRAALARLSLRRPDEAAARIEALEDARGALPFEEKWFPGP